MSARAALVSLVGEGRIAGLAALVTLVTLVALVAPGSASAQGSALSGPTTADAASAWLNPASMGAGTGTNLELIGGLAALRVQYAPEQCDPNCVPRPGAAPSSTSAFGPLGTLGGFTDAAHPDWRIGFTLGLIKTAGGSWSRDDGAAAITRYYLVSGASFHISAVPAVSWTPVDWLTIGLGANLVYASAGSDLDKDFGAQLNQTAGSTEIDAPFPYAHPDLAAPVSVQGDGFGLGGILGFLIQPIPELSFGTSVHSPVVLASSGTLSVEYPERLQQFVADTLPTAELPDLNGSIGMDLDLPLLFVFGVTGRPHEMVEIMGQYRFEHTSSQPNFYVRIDEATSDSITDTIKPQAFVDRHFAMLRVAVLPVPELRIAAYGSFQNNTVPNETLAPSTLDFHRVEIGLAARWHIVPEFSVLLQYNHLFLLDVNVATSLYRPLAEPSLTAFNHPSANGSYTGQVDSVRLGVGLHL